MHIVGSECLKWNILLIQTVSGDVYILYRLLPVMFIFYTDCFRWCIYNNTDCFRWCIYFIQTVSGDVYLLYILFPVMYIFYTDCFRWFIYFIQTVFCVVYRWFRLNDVLYINIMADVCRANFCTKENKQVDTPE